MKKLILLICVFVASFSFSFASSSNPIFNPGNTEAPYCNDGECSFQEGLEQTKGVQGMITEGRASDYIQRVIIYLMYFLELIAIIIIIYSGFNMLTAAGDEDKFNNSKKILIYSIIGLVVIFLAGPITRFILDVFVKS